MENENDQQVENSLLELIITSVNSNNNILLHRYYIELLNIGNIGIKQKTTQ